MLNKIIIYSFYLLFFLTPLFWTSLNYELFEFNKMYLVYAVTTVISGAWILKMIQERALILKRTPLDIPLLLFLGANILSTIFSIDIHTSIWGYYSRLNGGLLSTISYLLLYFAFVSNITSDQIKSLLKFGIASGLIISIWGILEHFGISLSCVILRGEFNAGCWVQDVQARVFASLGQPNWLAGYLAMLIFPALFLYLTTTSRVHIIYYTILLIFYTSFTFTYSRGPTLGLIGGMVVFLGFYFIQSTRKNQKIHLTGLLIHPVFRVLLGFLIINLLFGSALTDFRLISKFAPPPRSNIILSPPTVTQLEQGGTESSQIRLIVWKGGLDIFKNYPLLGSGVETFAYSYYQFRLAEHNLTTEWDFLYNKAHNEYINYLATTGIVGFASYIIIIITFIIIILKKHRKNLLIYSLLASYISYLIYNFFLFSVVILAIFFYLFPAVIFVSAKSLKDFKIPSGFHFISSGFQIIYHRSLYTKLAKSIVIFFTLYFLYSIFKLWYADTIFNLGQDASYKGNPGRAYNFLTIASDLNSGEPFYKSELAYAAAAAASALKESDASLAAELKDQADLEMEKVLRDNPKNVSLLRTAIRTYFELISFDQIYLDKTLQVLDKAITLAPTDPKLYYNKGLILQSIGKKKEALELFRKALELKPNYLEVQEQLKEATNSAVK